MTANAVEDETMDIKSFIQRIQAAMTQNSGCYGYESYLGFKSPGSHADTTQSAGQAAQPGLHIQ
ncbi:MAG: hypothetical protein AB7E47_04950 [Desulfovibrionaceae bacterium]